MNADPATEAAPGETRRLEQALRFFVVLLGCALALNNLLPYVGLRDDSCQTMFSGLEWQEASNNHVFMPQRALADTWMYWVDVRVRVEPSPEENSHDDMLLRWMRQPTRALNTEAIRAVVDQLCERRQVSLRWRERHFDEEYEAADACSDARLTPAPLPFRVYETDFNQEDTTEGSAP